MTSRHLQITSFACIAASMFACAEAVGPNADGTSAQAAYEAEYGISGGIEPALESGKEDTVTGPSTAWERTDSVWEIRNQWSAVTAEAGMAWPANSGLTWDQKFEAWVQSLEITDRAAGGQTFTVTTPYGVSLPAPSLECSEVAIFLRAAFASWYGLPFYLKASSNGRAIYLGHFGFRNADGSRFSNTPAFRTRYRDYTASWTAGAAWPSDTTLRGLGLHDGADEVPFLPAVNGRPARAGAYMDAFFLNKRVGHFMLLAMSWFGSMNLADDSNMAHITPEATRAGDVLLHRWQRSGIGHTLQVMRVTRPVEGRLEIALASGSMPRRQPVWEEGASAVYYFTSEDAGGPGTNVDGQRYASLGGGIRRWRTAVAQGSIYVNRMIDSSVVIPASAVDTIAARPERFSEILASVSPEEVRDAAIGRIEAARAHLAQYPASCSARERREQGFDTLYAVMGEHFGMDREAVDARYRVLADYVFAELEYTRSRTCCWNSSTADMYEIVMNYAESEQAAAEARNECIAPTVFMGRNRGTAGDGYQMYKAYATTLGRAAEWVAWRADESCPQSNVVTDTQRAADWTPFCDLDEVADPGDPAAPGCGDNNDTTQTATALSAGSTRGQVCSATDQDWYRIQVPTRQAVEIEVRFSHAAGDLDILLNDANGQRVAASESTTDVERIAPTLAAGTYYLNVHGWSGAMGSYDVTLRLVAPATGTCGDAGSSAGTAVPTTGSRTGLQICADETDFWRYSPTADGRVRVTIRFQHSRGDLDMAVLRTTGEQLGASGGTGDSETVDVDVRRGTDIVVKVFGYGGATGGYDLDIRPL